jgi:hypothetical protein
MRIINREKFSALPAGVLFSKYEPYIFGDLMIKGESISGRDGHFIDFFVQQITDAVACDDSGEFVDILDRAEKMGESFALDLDYQGRDGCLDEDQLFAVWEADDLQQLIARLQKCQGAKVQ